MIRAAFALVMGLVAGVALAACQPDVEPGGLLGANPSLTDQKRCEAEGGNYAQGGIAGMYICFRSSPDAGKSCSAGSECSGMCMADTRTCSRVEPMFGCHNILMGDGTVAGLCID